MNNSIHKALYSIACCFMLYTTHTHAMENFVDITIENKSEYPVYVGMYKKPKWRGLNKRTTTPINIAPKEQHTITFPRTHKSASFGIGEKYRLTMAIDISKGQGTTSPYQEQVIADSDLFIPPEYKTLSSLKSAINEKSTWPPRMLEEIVDGSFNRLKIIQRRTGSEPLSIFKEKK